MLKPSRLTGEIRAQAPRVRLAGERDHAVTLPNTRLSVGDQRFLIAHHGDQNGSAGQGELRQAFPVCDGRLADLQIADSHIPDLFLQHLIHTRPIYFLADHFGDIRGTADDRIHAKPFENLNILGIVDSRDGSGHTEILARQLAGNQVVLIIPRNGDQDIGVLDARIPKDIQSVPSPQISPTPSRSSSSPILSQ